MIFTFGHGRVPMVFWGTDVPGAENWSQDEFSTSLDPDGCVVRRCEAIATETNENTDVSETARGKWDAKRHTSAKKCKRCVREEFFLLTGTF